MASLGDLMVRVGANIDNFEKSMGTVSQRLNAIDKEANKATSGFDKLGGRLTSLGLGMSAALTAPLVGIGAAAIKISEQINMARLAFTTMLGSGEKAASFLKELQQFAATTPFEFSDLVQSAKRMQALGFEASQVIPTLRTVGDSAAALGAGKDFIDGVTLALGQMSAKGKVSAQEMNQLAERGVPAWEILAKAIGVGIPEAMKLAEKGAISASVAVPAILEGMNQRFSGQMAKASQTLTGVWSNFKDNATLTLAEIGNTLTPVVLSLVQSAMPLLQWAKDSAKWFAELPEPVRNTAIGMVALLAAVGPLTLALGGMITAFSGISKAVIAAGAGLKLLGGALVTVQVGFGAFTTTILPAVLSALTTFATVTVPTTITALSAMASTMLSQATGSFLTFARTAIPAAITALTTFFTTTIPAAITAVSTFTVSTIPAATASLIAFARTGVAAAAAALVGFASTAIPAAISGLHTLALTVLPLLGVAAAAAAAVFAGWKLGQWAYEQIPGMKALGDSIAGLLLMIPGVEAGMNRLTGASKATNEANESLAFSVKKLEEELKKKGVTVDRGGKSLSEYANELQKAAKSAQSNADNTKQGTTASEKYAKALEDLKKNLNEGASEQERLEKSVKSAKLEYDSVFRAFNAGKASVDQLTAAQQRLQKAQDLLNPERVAERYAKAHDEMSKRYEELAKFFIETTETLKRLDRELADSRTDLAIDYGKAHEQMRKEALKTVEIIVPLSKRLPEGIQEAIKKNKELSDAYKNLGITSSADLSKMATEAQKAYEKIRDSGVASAKDVLAAERAALAASIAARTAAGEVISAQDKKRIADLDKVFEKQVDNQKKLAQQVSTIVTDLGRSLVDRIGNLFKPDQQNEQLKKEEESLRGSLAERERQWVEYQSSIEDQLRKLNEDHGEYIAEQEADLKQALSEKAAEWETYRAETIGKIEDIRKSHAAAAEQERMDVVEGLREQEKEYAEYRSDVLEQIDEVKRANEESLADDLGKLQDQLRDKTRAYEEYSQDVQESLGRIREEFLESVSDRTRDTQRGVQDRQKQFKRDEEDLKDRIASEKKKGSRANQEQIRDWEKTLDRKREDLQDYTKRADEDLQEFVDDHKKKAEQQEADLRLSFQRRTEEHRRYVAGQRQEVADVTIRHREQLEQQVNELQSNLGKRTADWEAYRVAAAAKLAKITEDHATQAAAEEADLMHSLDERKKQWDEYKVAAVAKFEELRSSAQEKLTQQEADLKASLDKQRIEFDTFKTDATSRLGEIESEFKGAWERIAGVVTGALTDMGIAIGRFVTEEIIGKFAKSITDLLDGPLASLGKTIGGLFGSGVDAAGEAAGSAAGAAGSAAGSAGSAAGAAGQAAGQGVTAIVGAVSGVVTAIAGVVTAIGTIRLEGTMNAIEHNTRYSMLYLSNGDGGILGVSWRILDQISFGFTAKASEAMRDLLLAFTSPALVALEAISSNTHYLLAKVDDLFWDIKKLSLISDVLYDIKDIGFAIKDSLAMPMTAAPIAAATGGGMTFNIHVQADTADGQRIAAAIAQELRRNGFRGF